MLDNRVDNLIDSATDFLESVDFPEPQLTSNNTEELLVSYSKIQKKRQTYY